ATTFGARKNDVRFCGSGAIISKGENQMSHVFTGSEGTPGMINEHDGPGSAGDNRDQSGTGPRPVHLEAVLEAARPRLLRFVRRQGVSLDGADDVVQETLLEAWRHLDRVYSYQGVDAWLNKICWH